VTAELPTLGVGLGFRAPFLADLFSDRERVDFLEITADHFLGASPEALRMLDLLADHFPLIPHGLRLSLGSAEGVDEEYLEALAGLVRQLDPPWWSEHVAFTRAGGVDIGHLAPLPFTREALGVLCRNIDAARRRIDVPLILENITYNVAMPGAEMGEADFLTELLDRSGCGLLLDVTNLHTNAVNHGLDAADFLDRLPLDRVVQLHVAGGHWHESVLVDSHSSSTPPEVWALVEAVVAHAPVKGVILERDEDLPPFDELLGELDRARDREALRAMGLAQCQNLLARLYTDAALRGRFFADPRGVGAGLGLSAAEASGLAQLSPAQVGFYARSLRNKRCNDAAKMLPMSRRALGAERFDRLFLRHVSGHPYRAEAGPQGDALAFAEAVEPLLGRGGIGPPWAADVLRFEAARLGMADPARRWAARWLRHSPADLSAAVSAGPGQPPPVRPTLAVWVRPVASGRLLSFVLSPITVRVLGRRSGRVLTLDEDRAIRNP
jgi:uncharacterized protein (UPF0276 family)